MKFENVKVFNIESALRGMRNPKNSWAMSDSYFNIVNLEWTNLHYRDIAEKWVEKIYPNITDRHSVEYTQAFDKFYEWLKKNSVLDQNEGCKLGTVAIIGPEDMGLAQRLIKAGSEHRKFMRQIFVSVDITAPLYWWKEFDTYKVGTVANSTSTMHKIDSKPITLDCFEIDDFNADLSISNANVLPEERSLGSITEGTIDFLESLRLKYKETGDKRYWKELIRWLPESWLQTRTVTMSYENLLAMCSRGQRRFHKLTEWSGDGPEFISESFIKFARTLPYASAFIFIDELNPIIP